MLVVIAIGTAGLFARDMHRAYTRIEGKSSIVPSIYGNIEYSQRGAGQPVLVIHGSGGGFDNGELLAQAVLDEDFRAVTPSRFGYLRSTFQPGATFDDQAHAYAFLLDHLRIKKAAVVAISHGGPSALLFAALYPHRVSSLTLISAGVASSSAPGQAEANERGSMLMTIFNYDFAYWFLTKAFRQKFINLMGANDDVTANLTDEQRVLVDSIIDHMNPVSLRAKGAAFDNKAAMPNERVRQIRASVLILHAADDTLQLYENAEYAASRIHSSRLVRFEKGGHLLLATEQSNIRALVMKHIRDHAEN